MAETSVTDPCGLELVVLPQDHARFLPDGSVCTAQRLLDEMHDYARLWPGPVAALLRPAPTLDLDEAPVVVDPADLPFGLFRANLHDERRLAGALVDAAVVLATLETDHLKVATICRRLGVPCVFATRHTLAARRQLLRFRTRNPFRRLHHARRLLKDEKQVSESLSLASGLQCCGTPTLDEYSQAIKSRLLYFESSATTEQLVDPAMLHKRLLDLRRGETLQLIYLGPLERAAGAHHLVRLARMLADRNIDFLLRVFGQGALGRTIERQIGATGLRSRVRLGGRPCCGDALLPTLGCTADLVIAPQPVDDSAPGYLDAFSAGVPVVGFANAAFTGLLRTARAYAMEEPGVATPVGSVPALAAAVEALDRDRPRLVRLSVQARLFARRHTRDRTLDRRIAHLRSLCRYPAYVADNSLSA